MTIGLSVTATTTNSATFAFASMGASGTIELQISPRADFQFCVCPTYTGIARTTPYTFTGLNQRGTYFARARTRLSGGTAETWSNVVTFRTTNGTAQTTTPAAVMITPALLLTPLVMGVMGAGSTQVTGYPADNMLRDAPVACRLVGTAGSGTFTYTIAADLGGQPFDTIALLNTNLPEDANVSIVATDNSDYSTAFIQLVTAATPFRASANLPGRNGYHGLWTFTQTTKRYLRIDVSANVPMAHIEHFIVGVARASKNIAIDKTESPLTQTTIERRRSGIPDRQFGYPMRRVEFDIAAVTEAQYETLYSDLIYRQNEAVLVVPNMKSGAFLHDRILYGDLSGGRTNMVNAPLFSRSFTVDSLI